MRTLPSHLRTALLVALGIVAGVVLSLLVRSFFINAPVHQAVPRQAVPAAGADGFLETVALETGVEFRPGHDVDVLVDAGVFPRLFDDVRRARASVTLQLYYCSPGRLADSLTAALERPARAGIPVLFLYDDFGCDLGQDDLRRLRAAGVRARPFRPVRWWSLHRSQRRSHARIVVVDGRVAYTGGFGVDDRWSDVGDDGEPGWRETSARFTGPAVHDLQVAFADGWAEAVGEILVAGALGPATDTAADSAAPPPAGALDRSVAGLLHSAPGIGSSAAERLLALTIAGARRTLFIANAYFVPDDDVRRMLIDAARRGVDVRILAPDEGTDVPVVRYASRAHYRQLLEGGVRIYEYRPAMMHAKTFVADGVWTSIGSMNLDTRSLAVNEEATLLVLDAALGTRMDSLFHADLERAREITLPAFRRRGLRERLRESLAVLSARIL